MKFARSLVWFRRDLRDFDHAALAAALEESREVHCAFVFDRDILDALSSPADRRVEFIRESLVALDASLRAKGGGLIVRHASAREAIPELASSLGVDAVFANRDYEPFAISRDEAVASALAERGIAFETRRDQVIFERDEILTQAGAPFSVFTPYKNAWLKALTPARLQPFSCEGLPGRLAAPPWGRSNGGRAVPNAGGNTLADFGGHALPETGSDPLSGFGDPALPDTVVPTLSDLGFARTNLESLGIQCGMAGGEALFRDFRKRIDRYHEARDFPSVKGPSYLSVHLRFGTVSIRELAAFAHARSLEADGAGAATWLSELIWREFYAQILWHHPHVVGHAFKPQYDALAFPNDPEHIAAWREGRTGYPIVDAAMRQLARTGYMHNRLRMIAASFLVKDLLVDWRIGEQWFANQLIDFDLASNNGGWQWAASTGCDAQPYFRIFNPVTQSERFDPEGAFIRRYVPELAALSAKEVHAPWRLPPMVQQAKGVVIGRDYPPPIVDHAVMREQALELFGKARG